jgi:hypothetical protein
MPHIRLSELKANPAKYFDLSKTDDVIVMHHGQRLGRIVCEEKAVRSDKATAFDELMRFVNTSPSAPDNAVYDVCKEERLREKGLL